MNGIKTSEFAVSIIPVILGVVLLVIGVLKGNAALMEHGQWLMLGGSGTYGVSRGLAKLGGVAPQPPAEVKTSAQAAAVVSEVK